MEQVLRYKNINEQIMLKKQAHTVIHHGYLPLGHERKVFNWATSIGMSLRVSDNVIDPRTFEPTKTWFFETEEDKVIFLLKWR